MFRAKTQKLEILASKYAGRIHELDAIFSGATNVYVDFANVRPWSEKLHWHVDPKRIKQLFESFPNFNSLKLYTGELDGDVDSEKYIEELRRVLGKNLITKPVKIMSLPINVSSIPNADPAILKNFIRLPLLRK